MQLDHYFKFHGIKGNAAERNHQEWVTLNYLTITNTHYDDNISTSLYMTKNIDGNSPLLYQLFQSGKSISEVMIDLVTSSEDVYRVYRYILKNCQLVSLNTTAHQQVFDEYTWNPQTGLIIGNLQEEIGINYKSIELICYLTEEEFAKNPMVKDKKTVSPSSPGSPKR